MQAGNDGHSNSLAGVRSAKDEEERKSRGLVSASGSSVRLASRSPHPYHRKSSILESTSRIKPDLAHRSRQEPLSSGARASGGSLRSQDDLTRRRSRVGESPNESGTEADDEGMTHFKALPAPPLKARKGWKFGADGSETPLLTPSAIDEEGARLEFPFAKSDKAAAEQAKIDQGLREARAKFVRRRRAELGRRASEVLLIVLIGMLILGNELIRSSTQLWHRAELLSHVFVVSTLYLLYPVRLIAYAWKRTKPLKPIQKTIRLPAAFDPAPLLYPEFLPTAIAIILLPSYPKALLLNLVLGLASIPGGLFRFGNWDIDPLRWLVSIVPLIATDHTDFPHKNFAIKPYQLKLDSQDRVPSEIITLLYPLHQSLVSLIQYLTTTSLLPAEVHLLSIGLINLLLCAEMPPTRILQTLLWLGGLSTYMLIGPVIRWNIALARVPRWRFRRAGRLIQLQQSFLSALNRALNRRQSAAAVKRADGSDADDDHETGEPLSRKSTLETIKSELLRPIKTNLFSTMAKNTGPQSAIEPTFELGEAISNGAAEDISKTRPRRNTLPNLGTDTRIAQGQAISDQRRRKIASYGKTLFGKSLASISRNEAFLRKWAYAAYTFSMLILLILGPIRNVIARYALNGHEPFGWAVGYLFGDIPQIRNFVQRWYLNWWVPLRSLPEGVPWQCSTSEDFTLGIAACIRETVIGPANMRLLLCLYCVAIIILGLGVVLGFTFVEVDTRRKVFHGMMVAMLLPTIFIDPAFISLALIIVLAIFLILDLIRASQLPPLSRPIAMFLTPYVDGRDLRGPVVVSHIFLLIGCAVPLWLSLAGLTFNGDDPWKNWEVEGRDLSMIAGVVCVGMGDAAASLIGRRYGRRKWPWTGGKSLEGSSAFAIAVMIGLVVGKAWLRLGQWENVQYWNDWNFRSWSRTAVKAGVAGCGASFMEAVLTGGNDNVVVPVVLWILVQALDI